MRPSFLLQVRETFYFVVERLMPTLPFTVVRIRGDKKTAPCGAAIFLQ